MKSEYQSGGGAIHFHDLPMSIRSSPPRRGLLEFRAVLSRSSASFSGPRPPVLDPSGHHRTSTASAGLQMALGTTGPQLRVLDRSGYHDVL